MIYVLKFGAGFVLPPGCFFVVFWVLAFWAWRRGEKRVATAVASVTFVFYVLSTGFVADILMRDLEATHTPPDAPTGDVIIMLGGGALQDTPDVDGIGTITSSPSARMLAVVRLWRRLHVPIVLSGGQVYADTGAESVIGKRILMSLGVPENEIFTETKSLTTSQNARFTAEILKAHGFTRPILVTSAFHLPRAVLTFQKNGVEVTPYPTDFMTNRNVRRFHYNHLQPSADALCTSARVMQERLRAAVTRYLE